MASAIATNKLRCELFVAQYDHDPGATTAVLLSPDGGTTPTVIDMSQYSHLLVLAAIRTGTSVSITKLEIVAAELATMASPEVIKDSGTVAADAVADYVMEECSASEIVQIGAAAGKELRYACARLTQGGNADNEASVVYIAIPRHEKNALSANNIT